MSLRSLFFPPTPIAFTKSIRVPAMVAGTLLDYDAERTLKPYRKFMPFYTFQAWNNSNAEIEFYFDYNNKNPLPCARQSAATRKNLPFYSFQIKNISSAVSVAGDELIIILERIQ